MMMTAEKQRARETFFSEQTQKVSFSPFSASQLLVRAHEHETHLYSGGFGHVLRRLISGMFSSVTPIFEISVSIGLCVG